MAGEAIFIGYRRDDTADVAGRIYDAMAQRFGRNRIFKDVDNIGPGVDFGDYIKTVLPRCRVALVLIGPHWLDSADEGGRRRIDDDQDWVRVEVETALATPGLLVVPVLVNGARMPRTEETPDSLKPLLRRNAAIIRRDPDFHDDIERLASAIRASVGTGAIDLSKIGGGQASAAPAPVSRRLVWTALVASIVVAILATALVWAPWRGASSPGASTDAGSTLTTAQTEPMAPAPSTNVESPSAPPSTGAGAGAAAQDNGERRAGQVFRDCDDCPDMVAIPQGGFRMGSPQSESARDDDEGPQRRINLHAFAASRYEITFDQWATCVNRGGCAGNPHPSDEGFTRGSRPVINVSWNDAQEYLRWLSAQTNERYRLLTEAEWEYAARSGSTTQFSWGDQPPVCDPNARNGAAFDGCSDHQTRPVGSFGANAFGLFDMHGNVWEWVQDCYAAYDAAPTDGGAYETANCAGRVYRGGGWNYPQRGLRSANRERTAPSDTDVSLGFRVARTLR